MATDLLTPEILTVEQFALRMQVSRTTVFGWLKNKVLEEGVHYFRVGRILRLCWREGLFLNSQQKQLSEDKGPSTPLLLNRSEIDSQRGEAPVNSPLLTLPLTLRRGSAPGVNLDY
jgi:hypothetical protein